MNYDVVGSVDGDWGKNNNGLTTGGIRGFCKNKDGKILYMFSGPIQVYNNLAAEIKAILHLIS